MLFSQIEFVLLLSAVFAFVLLVRHHPTQKWFLLLASYYFYAYWDWRFAGLMLACSAVTHACAVQIRRRDDERGRRAWLATAVVFNLGLLGFFKYYNFFADSWNDSFAHLFGPCPLLKILLPVGISFFTFHALNFVIDVYRGKIERVPNLRDLALYISFFPQMIAGPIVRATEMLPQIETPRSLSWDRAAQGFRIYVFGFFKKIFIADHLSGYVDQCFANAGMLDGATLWLATLAYAIQIYCDFSGYSDMAIGMAKALGYDFSVNFNHPYLARNVQEFWHRWHISLSSWLRDYLYIPLGGSRKGRVRTYVNLMLTMLLGGLWHGANWTFVAWGGLHGGALAVHKWFSERFGAWHPIPAPLGAAFGWCLTMLVVLVGWVLFRAQSFRVASSMLARMFTWESGLHWIHPFALLAVGLLAVGHICSLYPALRRFRELDVRTVGGGASLFTLLGIAVLWKPEGFQPFIYFQF